MGKQRKSGALIVISGPSGAGKGTIVERLLDEENIELSVSCTTRKPRPHEKEGVNYFFKREDEFDEMAASGEFLEYADVFGCRYGTPGDRVTEKLREGKSVILEIDVQGAMQVKRNYPKALLVFILPPSEEALLARLNKRATETEEQIAARLAKARGEMSFAKTYDHAVVNGDLDAAVAEVKEIITKYLNGNEGRV